MESSPAFVSDEDTAQLPSVKKGLRMLVDSQMSEPAVCLGDESDEGQQHPGLDPQQCGQQAENYLKPQLKC